MGGSRSVKEEGKASHRRAVRCLPLLYNMYMLRSATLSSDQEVVVLLASLDEEVAVGDELSCGD